MAQARRSLIKLHDTPYYHVAVRCTRRAWLSGVDAVSGKDYSHRAMWIRERLAQLAAVFCIDVCAYSIMRNYYEAVLHVDRARGALWTTQEVMQRWCTLYRAPKLTAGGRSGTPTQTQGEAARRVEQWRAQLSDISWFMRCLNEVLARRANAEDGCTGAFWETRFKCRPLASEASLLAAMAYVDLSPVRTPALATGIPGSTSIQARIEHSMRTAGAQPNLPLLPFATSLTAVERAVLPLNFREYLELLDWTGRRLPTREAAALDSSPRILQRLGLNPATWLHAMQSENSGPARPLERLRRQVERSARCTAAVSDRRGIESVAMPPGPPRPAC